MCGKCLYELEHGPVEPVPRVRKARRQAETLFPLEEYKR